MSQVYTSYFAKVAKIDTSNYCLAAITRAKTPTWFEKPCLWMPQYAPSWDLLNDWKQGLITWEEYTERYNKEMNLPYSACIIKHEINETMALMNKDIILLCYEKSQCHRFLLGDAIGAKEL